MRVIRLILDFENPFFDLFILDIRLEQLFIFKEPTEPRLERQSVALFMTRLPSKFPAFVHNFFREAQITTYYHLGTN